MLSLKQLSLDNNLKVQDWVNQKIEFSENQIKLWTSRLNDKSYRYTLSYVNFQIGKYTLDKDYYKYLKNLLISEHKEIIKEKDNDFIQVKI